MQQVGSSEFIASAQLIDPKKLPALLSHPTRRALVVARHTWVLHRPAVVRGAAAAVVLLGLALGWEQRDTLMVGFQAASDVIEAKFVEAGFSIKAISITGQALTPDADIVKALAIEPRLSTLNFDAEAARARVEELPAIKEATVRKVYPGHVDVIVTEKTPIARWRVDGVTFLVDDEGEQLAADSGAYSELPLIVGDGAADDAMAMLKAMERYDKLKSGLAALSRIGDRRWDLIYYTGLRVQLPELGVGQALAQLQAYQDRYKLLDRDVTLIDLRVPGVVALRPGELAIKQRAEAAKSKKKKKGTAHAVDPAYETPSEQHGD